MSESVISESVISESLRVWWDPIIWCEMQDSSIATSKPVLDLVDAIKPESVNYELFESGKDEDVRH